MQITQPTLQTHISHALKICKHEFLMSRILLIIVCIINLVNLLLLISNDTDSFVFGILVLMQYFAFIICAIAYLLSAAISFYQGVFGKHAYLTHSLPIQLETIICAKILIYFLWFLVIFASFIFTLYLSTKDLSLVKNFMFLLDNGNEKLWDVIIHGTILVVLTALQEIIFIFMVVALVHRKKTYTLLIGILTYFGIKILLLIIGVMLERFLLDGMEGNSSMIVLYCYQVALIALFYFICHRIIKYKLSI